MAWTTEASMRLPGVPLGGNWLAAKAKIGSSGKSRLVLKLLSPDDRCSNSVEVFALVKLCFYLNLHATTPTADRVFSISRTSDNIMVIRVGQPLPPYTHRRTPQLKYLINCLKFRSRDFMNNRIRYYHHSLYTVESANTREKTWQQFNLLCEALRSLNVASIPPADPQWRLKGTVLPGQIFCILKIISGSSATLTLPLIFLFWLQYRSIRERYPLALPQSIHWGRPPNRTTS